MRVFLIKILLISILPIIFLSISAFLAINHQLNNYEEVIKYEQFLIGEPHQENYARYYKFNKNLDSIQILAIGSSRVLGFKSEFFAKPFFNLGKLARTPQTMVGLIQSLNIKNKTIIIAIDPWTLNSQWSGNTDSIFKFIELPTLLSILVNPQRCKSIIEGKIFPDFKSHSLPLFGTGAHQAVDGFLRDGSYYYGKKIHGNLTNNANLLGDDYQFNNTIFRIKTGTFRFEFGKIANPYLLKKLEELMIENKIRNNQVIFYFPPFPPTIRKLLKNENYAYIPDAAMKVSYLAKKYQVQFFDFTNVESTDDLFIDGLHSGAKLNYELLNKMGIPTRPIDFINNFETQKDSAYTQLRLQLFR